MRDHLDEAEAYYHRVVDIYRAIYGDHHYYVAVAISNIGAVNMDRKTIPAPKIFFAMLCVVSQKRWGLTM